MVDDLIEETRQRFNVTSVVISHDMASCFRIAHKAYLLTEGKVAAEGTPRELAFGDNQASREFIQKSGISLENLDRIVDDD
jgi:phospholipid/cholesterol/gamma-HCH transport system ATP-binding protein